MAKIRFTTMPSYSFKFKMRILSAITQYCGQCCTYKNSVWMPTLSLHNITLYYYGLPFQMEQEPKKHADDAIRSINKR